MPFTIEQLNTLEAAIAQGATTVKYADKEVTYRSMDEMFRLRDLMRSELGLNGTDPNKNRVVFASFDKGYL